MKWYVCLCALASVSLYSANNRNLFSPKIIRVAPRSTQEEPIDPGVQKKLAASRAKDYKVKGLPPRLSPQQERQQKSFWLDAHTATGTADATLLGFRREGYPVRSSTFLTKLLGRCVDSAD